MPRLIRSYGLQFEAIETFQTVSLHTWVTNTLEAVSLVRYLLRLFWLLLPPAGTRGGGEAK
jgi:hypothetical protein